MSFLFVNEDGVVLARESERLIVRDSVDVLSRTPVHSIDAVVACGRVEVTRPALDMLLSRNIPVHFLTGLGRYQGCAQSPLPHGARRRRKQYALLDDEMRCLELARACVRAKLLNQLAVARGWNARRRDPEIAAAIEGMRGAVASASAARSVEVLRGEEGAASRQMYRAMRATLDPALGFVGRRKRPAVDPVNAALSLFGSILAGTATAAVTTAGLDPYCGPLHGDSREGPALALDLADVYRPLVCVAPAVTLFTKRMLSPADFVLEEAGLRLRRESLHRTLGAFAAALHREVRRRDSGTAHPYLRHLVSDARSLASFIDERRELWSPLVVR